MASKPQAAKADPRRNKLLAKIHIAKSRLCLDEDTYRDVLRRHGAESAADLPVGKLIAIVEEFKKKGWRDGPPRRAQARRLADSDVAGKIRALWLSGWHLGVIRDAGEPAIAAFVKRQARVDALAFLPADRADAVIEALKTMLARDGGVRWPTGAPRPGEPESRAARDKIAVIAAQARKLGLGVGEVTKIGWQSGLPVMLGQYEEPHLDRLIALLGERVRAAKAEVSHV